MTNTTKKVLIYGSLTIALVGIYFLAKAKPKPKPVENIDPEEECKKKGEEYYFSKKKNKCLKKAQIVLGENADFTFCKKFKVEKDTFIVKDPMAFALSLRGIQIKSPSVEKVSAGTIITAKASDKKDAKNGVWMELCDEKTGESTKNGFVQFSILNEVK
jgi:hypothetical protein